LVVYKLVFASKNQDFNCFGAKHQSLFTSFGVERQWGVALWMQASTEKLCCLQALALSANGILITLLFTSFGAERQWVQSTNGKNQLIPNKAPMVSTSLIASN